MFDLYELLSFMAILSPIWLHSGAKSKSPVVLKFHKLLPEKISDPGCLTLVQNRNIELIEFYLNRRALTKSVN